MLVLAVAAVVARIKLALSLSWLSQEGRNLTFPIEIRCLEEFDVKCTGIVSAGGRELLK
jgi:hypothetical protein